MKKRPQPEIDPAVKRTTSLRLDQQYLTALKKLARQYDVSQTDIFEAGLDLLIQRVKDDGTLPPKRRRDELKY